MCECVFDLFIIQFSPLSPSSLWRWTHTASEVSVRTTKPLQLFITNSLSPPLFHVTWEAKVEHVHRDIGQGRVEKGWLIGDVSPEGTLSAFWPEKWMTVSVCSAGIQRRVRGEGQNGDNKVPRSRKLCHYLWRGKKNFWGDQRHAVYQSNIAHIVQK